MSTTADAMMDGGRSASGTYDAATGELYDRRLILKYMAAASFWLVFAPTVGAIVSLKFNFYDFLGHVSWLTWGRLRYDHTQGIMLGWLANAFFAFLYHAVPLLTGRPVTSVRLGLSRPAAEAA